MTNILVTKGAIYCENNFALSLRVTYLHDGTVILSLEMNSENCLALDLKIQIPHTTHCEVPSLLSRNSIQCHMCMRGCSSKIKVVHTDQISNKFFFFIPLLQISRIPSKCWIFRETLRQNRRLSSLRVKASYRLPSKRPSTKNLSMKYFSTQSATANGESKLDSKKALVKVRIPCTGFIGGVLISLMNIFVRKPRCSLL